MTPQHAISKVNLTVNAPRSADGFALQNEISRWFWDNLSPELENILNQLVASDEVITIERLQINIPPVTFANWQRELTPSVCRAFEEALKQILHFPKASDTGVVRQSISQSQFDTWLIFLKTGNLPFTITENKDRLEAVLETVAINVLALERLKSLLQNNVVALERLVKQHDSLFLTQLAAAMSAKSQAVLPKMEQALVELFTSTAWRQLLNQPLQTFSPREVSIAFWTSIFKQLRIDNRSFIDNQTIEPLFSEHVFPEIIQQLFNKNWVADILPALILISKKEKAAPQMAVDEATIDINTTEQLSLNPILQTALIAFSEGILIRTLLSKIMEGNKNSLATTLKNNPSHFYQNKSAMPSDTTPTADTMDNKNKAANKTALDTDPLSNTTAETPTKEKAINKGDISDENIPAEAHKEKENHPINDKNEAVDSPKELFVTQAGIVLLHPFIKPFFESLNIIIDNQFKDEAARVRGVHLLHYLATGEEQAPEYDLIMHKMLCQMPFETPIDRYIELTDLEKKEAEELLQTVINYWSALGSVSSDSLRQGFLKRAGKLSRRDDDWLLQVESQTLDILIDRLPWGMSIIKLPWMTNMLFVEWH